MEKVRLGADGPTVGAVGLGCMSFGGIYGPTDMAESHATLARAWDLGVTHLDVANIYGDGVSESVIGAFLKDNPRDFSIATKASIVSGPPRRFDNSQEHLTQELEGSLKRLGVEHVDLFYIHRRDPSIEVEDVMETLLRLKDQGKIGGIGFSEIAPSTLQRACACGPVMAVQNEYSLWTRLPELGLLQACNRYGATFVSFSPVGRGIFADVFPDISSFRDGDFRKHNPRFVEPNYSANKRAITPLQEYAHDNNMSFSTLAIAWTLAKAPGSMAIPGTRSVANLEKDAAAGSIKLSADQMAEIEKILPVGFAHGARYSDAQSVGPEYYA